MKTPLQIFKIGTRSGKRVVEPRRSHGAQEIQLPNELVALILSYAALADNPAAGDSDLIDFRPLSLRCRKQAQPILSTSCLVSKLWNHIATELLYESIYLTSPRSLSILSTALSRRKELRSLVLKFVYAPPKNVTGSKPGEMPFFSWLAVRRIHLICPHLESRTIKQAETPTKRYGRLLLRKTFLPSAHPLNTGKVHTQSLTKLEIESIWTSPELYMPESLVFTQLQDLTLKGFNTRHFANTFMRYPTMPQLIRLQFKDCSFYGVGLDLPLPKNCPRLRIFEIVGGSIFQLFWKSFEQLAKETHIESLTFVPTMTLGAGRPPINNLHSWLPDLYEMHIMAECFVWETNPPGETLIIPNKVRHLVVEAARKVNHNNLSMMWVASVQYSVEVLLGQKELYGPGIEAIVIWASADKNAWARHANLVNLGAREGVRVEMFDKTPRASTRISNAIHKLSPMF